MEGKTPRLLPPESEVALLSAGLMRKDTNIGRRRGHGKPRQQVKLLSIADSGSELGFSRDYFKQISGGIDK